VFQLLGGGRLDVAVAFVDWQNLRTSLACGGVTAAPVWVLRELAYTLRQVAGSDGRRLGRIELHFTTEAESRADRHLLEHAPVGSPVVIQLADRGRSTPVAAIAMGAGQALYQNGHAIIAVSSDLAVAHLAARYAREASLRGRVRLLHRRPRAARISEAEDLGIAQPLELDVGERITPRPWTPWDVAAWRLFRLAAPTDDRIARALLREPSRGQQKERWASTIELGVDFWRLEQVDDLLAALWRRLQGQPIHRAIAEREAISRLGRAGGAADPAQAIDALLAAQLLRHRRHDYLEVPSGWREGLLLPIRRVILRLARRNDHADRLSSLLQQHRSRFYSVRGSAPIGQRRRPDQLELHSSGDSWRWVRHALRHRMSAVEQDTTRRSPDGRATTTWRLIQTEFTGWTCEQAEHILSELRTFSAGQGVEAALAEAGIVHPGRWLRCLRDVGLVTFRDGRWIPTEANLHRFEHIGG
jgi:hypothetical protein